MTRDETIALFRECEVKRKEAREAALAEGKHEDEAAFIAHGAAMSRWNLWASDMRAKRKELAKSNLWNEYKGNTHTRAWKEAARVDFSQCIFFSTIVEQAEAPRSQEKNARPATLNYPRACGRDGDAKTHDRWDIRAAA